MLNFPRWKQAAILITCLTGLLVVLPNFFSEQTLSRWPSWLPKWQLSLGLDLRGGAHLLYAMETNDVRKDWLDGLRDDARRRLREAKIAVSAAGISGFHKTRTMLRFTIDGKDIREMEVVELGKR